jgi:hypothetical protein
MAGRGGNKEYPARAVGDGYQRHLVRVIDNEPNNGLSESAIL